MEKKLEICLDINCSNYLFFLMCACVISANLLVISNNLILHKTLLIIQDEANIK